MLMIPIHGRILIAMTNFDLNIANGGILTIVRANFNSVIIVLVFNPNPIGRLSFPWIVPMHGSNRCISVINGETTLGAHWSYLICRKSRQKTDFLGSITCLAIDASSSNFQLSLLGSLMELAPSARLGSHRFLYVRDLEFAKQFPSRCY